MGTTETGVRVLARERDIELVPQVTRAGLSNRGHLDSILRETASARELEHLETIFRFLGGDHDGLLSKRPQPLRLDFYAPAFDVLIEIDEIQHFTTERRRTLAMYPHRIPDVTASDYRPLTGTLSQRADGYRATKPATDFPITNGRRAQRAYLDTVRDVGTVALGLALVRIPAPECDPSIAFLRLEQALGVERGGARNTAQSMRSPRAVVDRW